MVYTLGDVITLAMAVIGVPIVLYKLAKVWIWPLMRPFIMSRKIEAPAEKTDMGAVSIPVSEPPPESGIDWQMPRISAYLTDQEFLVFLARQKLRDGKYRFSANDVVKIIGGNRNEVLDVVRQVRAAPEYRDLTEQAQAA